MRFVRYDDLKAFGIPFSRVHIDRLQREGAFPRKIKLGPNTAVYSEAEILAWVEERMKDRNAA